MARKLMVRCVQHRRYGITEGCGRIETADRWTEKTRQYVQRNFGGNEDTARAQIPDLSEETASFVYYMCPLCCKTRNHQDGEMELVGYGEINIPTSG